MVKCKLCGDEAELAYYQGDLMCMACAKEEMWSNGHILREIREHEKKHRKDKIQFQCTKCNYQDDSARTIEIHYVNEHGPIFKEVTL